MKMEKSLIVDYKPDYRVDGKLTKKSIDLIREVEIFLDAHRASHRLMEVK